MQKLLSREMASIQALCRTEKLSDVDLRRILRCAILRRMWWKQYWKGVSPLTTLQGIVYERPQLLWVELRVRG